MIRPPPISTLFPYTTLFRSQHRDPQLVGGGEVDRHLAGASGFPDHLRHPLDRFRRKSRGARDRKSTRLNSSHEWISYAVFCLKKKKKNSSTGTPLSTQEENE